jgi:23S rRNA pseudouridine1911/1915/1917 synthase
MLGAHLHGMRLDKALQDFVPEFSRNYLQQLVEEGAVTLNGASALKPAQKVRAGDSVELQLRPTAQSQAFKPEPIALDVVYSDDHLVVVNKPAGLVVHPAPGNWSGTLLNALLHHFPGNAAVPRAGIVHRLDKDTSGLMVVARTRSCMDALVQAIAARTVSRQYLAIAHKAWRQGAMVTVEEAIGRDPRNRLRMAVVDLSRSAGKAARTDIYFLDNAAEICFVRCVLHTGRTHQIRVHMASLGHPLVADSVYGGQPKEGIERQALHAFALAFEHPVTGQPLAFRAPLPPDMQNLLALLGLRYNDSVGPPAAP